MPPGGLGVSLSGGGLRAASFGLGCLQELDARYGVLRGEHAARYLAAVSGGSYTGAAVSAVLAADAAAPGEDRVSRPLAPGSIEADLLAQRCNYFLRHGRLALLVDVLTLVVMGVVGLASVVLFLPALAAGLASGGFLVPVDDDLVSIFGGIGLLAGAGITTWAVRTRPGKSRGLTWVKVVLGTLVLVATLPSAAVLAGRIEPLRGPAWWSHHWLALLAAGLCTLAAALLLQRRRGSEEAFITFPRRLVGAGLAVLQGTLYGLAVLFPPWAAGAMLSAPALPYVVLVAAGYVLFYALSDASSFHYFYTYRVATCFGVYRERTGSPAFLDLPEVPMSFLRSDERSHPRPELLICAAANVTPPQSAVASFVISPSDVRLHGASGTSTIPTAEYERFYFPHALRSDPRRALTLFRAVGLSGAAISPSMGHMTVRAVRALMAFTNLRLGRWMPNPADASMRELAERPGPHPLRLGAQEALRELWGHHPIDAELIYVTDGGHFENLGIVELLRRRCGFIIAIDSSGDPPGPPRSLVQAIELAESELKVKVVLDTGPLERITDTGHTIRRCWAVGSADYGDGTRATVVVLRIGTDPDTPDDVLERARGVRRFPHTPTLDQFFNAEMFEAYAALGRASTATASRTPEIASVFDTWREATAGRPAGTDTAPGAPSPPDRAGTS